MKTDDRIFRGLQIAVLALFPAMACAQAVTPAAPPPETDEEVVVLSPFVVSGTRDTGYQATNTLAGTRLSTPVKDLGAAISIYTKDFLEDIGVNKNAELFVYATAMEAAGVGGNYSGTVGTTTQSAGVASGRGSATVPARVRGLAGPQYSRGYFVTDIPSDGYNSDAVTVNRGPNSILFGVGSPGGFVETAPDLPDLYQNRNRIQVRYGNNDSIRSSINLNRVLIEDKLAIKFAALHDDEQYNQRPAYERQQRLYGAITYQPFRQTSIRARFESGHVDANRPFNTPPYKAYTDFFLNLPTRATGGYDWTYFDDPAVNPLAASQNAGAFPSPLPDSYKYLWGGGLTYNGWVVYSSPNATQPDFAFQRTPRVSNTNTTANAIISSIYNPIVNRDSTLDNIQFITSNGLTQMLGGFWVPGNVPAAWLVGQQPGVKPAGLKTETFRDTGPFDWIGRQIDETGWQTDSFHSFNIELEQRAWQDRVGIQLAYDQQRYDRRNKSSFLSGGNANWVFIDNSKYFPWGDLNPNAGRPFMTNNQNSWSYGITERSTYRATGYLRYDFKDLKTSWSHWLGRHTLTGVAEENTVKSVSASWALNMDGDAARDLSPLINQGIRRYPAIVYMGPSIFGNNNSVQLESVQIPEQMAGPVPVPMRYFVRTAGPTDPGRFVDSPLSLVEFPWGGSFGREVIKSQAAVLQSYWLDDLLVTTFGWRRDEDYGISQSANYTFPTATAIDGTTITDTNAVGKVFWDLNDVDALPSAPLGIAKETTSYSAVLKWPQKLIALPSGSDLSVFYNKSDNFNASGSRTNTYGEPIDPVTGTTKEWGFNFSTLHDRLTLRLNWFETKVLNQTFGGVYGGLTRNAITNELRGMITEANRNPENVPFMNAAYEKVISALPQAWFDHLNYKVTGTAPNIAVSVGNPNRTDTTDFQAKGIEADLVYNLSRNWRILLNVAKQETAQTNINPQSLEFFARMKPVWESTVTDPRTGTVVNMLDIPIEGYDTGYGPANPNPADLTFREDTYNPTLVSFATVQAAEGTANAEQRKWRANLVTNYTFGPGSPFGEKLRGWSIGAAVRWQDKLGLGYPTSRDADGVVHIDIDNPWYAPAETNVDAWIGYTRKLSRDRIDWKVQLNVRNLVGERGFIATTVQPWGDIASVRIPPERRWYVTNTFSF